MKWYPPLRDGSPWATSNHTQELNDFQAVTDTGQMKGPHVFCFRKFMCGCVVLLIQNWQGIELEQKQAMFLEDDFSPE